VAKLAPEMGGVPRATCCCPTRVSDFLGRSSMVPCRNRRSMNFWAFAYWRRTREPRHYNPLGVAHAGFAATLLDSSYLQLPQRSN
jgi:hypothetical protein